MRIKHPCKLIVALIYLLLSLLAALSLTAHAANVLSNTAHAATQVNAAITTALGAGVVDVTVFSDETSTDNGVNFLTPSQFAAAATDAVRTNFRISNPATTENKAPYQIITQSSTGYTLQSVDIALYISLYNSGSAILYNWAMVYPASSIQPPPVIASNIIASAINPNSCCGWTEFAMSASYLGLDTSSSSNVAAGFAGLLTAVATNHPTWTAWDIKGAFRQTASNWATGWASNNYGYGTINYTNANALASTASIFMHPPLLVASGMSGASVTLTIYPFRQTRRDHEKVYVAPLSYAWPVKNEYTATDIANAVTAGAQLIYTSTNVPVIPSSTVTLPALPPGKYNLIAFTTDAGETAFSRFESFSPTAIQGLCL